MEIKVPIKISLKNHKEISEKLIQNMIEDDATILGLGELSTKNSEKIQKGAGKLDLLLQDDETKRRYEVELQLGRVDESHIIRTIEYWDIERKRYPQYDHCAVIIAEDITSRFLNVISLFNGYIPIIAIQVNAYEFEGKVFLVFTKILDELELGMDEDDEVEVKDRNYWIGRVGRERLALADQMLEIVHSFDPNYELNYNKYYIGLKKNGRVNNFIHIHIQTTLTNLRLKFEMDEEIEQILLNESNKANPYNSRWKEQTIKINNGDIEKNKEAFTILFKKAYDYVNNK